MNWNHLSGLTLGMLVFHIMHIMLLQLSWWFLSTRGSLQTTQCLTFSSGLEFADFHMPASITNSQRPFHAYLVTRKLSCMSSAQNILGVHQFVVRSSISQALGSHSTRQLTGGHVMFTRNINTKSSLSLLSDDNCSIKLGYPHEITICHTYPKRQLCYAKRQHPTSKHIIYCHDSALCS